MNKLVFPSPAPLNFPPNTSLKLYLINSNGVQQTPIATNTLGQTPGKKLNKNRILQETWRILDLDAMCVCETHNKAILPPTGANVLQSRQSEESRGTAVLCKDELLLKE